jgi:hypothetical protein
MMFLLRMAFWFSLVLLLLPFGTSADSGNPGAASVSPLQAFSAASAAVGDLSQFCKRQPEACVTGSQAAVVIGDKAQAAAGMMLDFLSKRNEAGPHTSSVTATEKAAEPPAQNTLTPADRALPWRGQQPRPRNAA